jgi:hypothetical protein
MFSSVRAFEEGKGTKLFRNHIVGIIVANINARRITIRAEDGRHNNKNSK